MSARACLWRRVAVTHGSASRWQHGVVGEHGDVEPAQLVAIVDGARRPPFRRDDLQEGDVACAQRRCAPVPPAVSPGRRRRRSPRPSAGHQVGHRAAIAPRRAVVDPDDGRVAGDRRAPPADLTDAPRERVALRRRRARPARSSSASRDSPRWRGEPLRHRVRAQQLGAEAVREQVADVIRLRVAGRRQRVAGRRLAAPPGASPAATGGSRRRGACRRAASGPAPAGRQS